MDLFRVFVFERRSPIFELEQQNTYGPNIGKSIVSWISLDLPMRLSIISGAVY